MVKYQFQRETIGALECGVVQPSEPSCPISSVAVFCHGFGAGGDDLVGLAPEILQRAGLTDDTQDQAGWVLVFPEGPVPLDEQGLAGGRAWWLLSIQSLLTALENGRYEQVREQVPAGIDDARKALVEVVDTVLQRHGLNESQLMLGGFSQGAMLSVDVALRGLQHPPAALILYSGCLICEALWKPLASRLGSTRILQSHGSLDPVLPMQTGKWLTGLLREAGCEVEFVDFEGVHTIPTEAIEKTAELFGKISGKTK